MRKIIIAFTLFPMVCISQSLEQNFVKTKLYKAETFTSISDGEADQVKVDVVYFDGLGRPIQKVGHQQSATGNDILMHISYDILGRQGKEFLPFVKNQQNMQFDANAEINTLNYGTYSGHPNPYSKKFFEKSPLNRVLKQDAPGLEWMGNETNDNDKAIKFIYDINTIDDQVQKFTASSGALGSTGFYQTGSLYKSIIKDENWISGKTGTVEEYKDNLGRTVLKRNYENETVKIETYYVYDSQGNLSFVIPPLASESITTIQESQAPYVYTQSINIAEMMLNYTNGGGSMVIKIENNILKLIFSAGFTAAQIDVSKTFTINAPYPIPDMSMGTLSAGFPRYSVFIENNQVKFADNYPASGNYTALNQTLSSSPLPGSNFQYQTVYNTVVNQQMISDLCYQYKYDSRFRLIEKKLPGKQWEYIVYDKLDRIVASGPADSPFPDLIGTIGWTVIKYDMFSRPVITAWLPVGQGIDSSTRLTLQTQMDGTTANFSEIKIASDNSFNGVASRYSNNAFPTSGYHILSINYYDDYAYTNAPVDFNPVETQEVYFNTSRKPKGMATGSWIRLLENSSVYTGELTYSLYDYKEQPLRTKTVNFLGGHTTVDNKMEVGKLAYSITRHARVSGINDLYLKDSYTYTPQDRLLTHSHQIGVNGIPQLLAKNEYDDLGQLISKKVGGTDISGSMPLQKVDYTYNIRGWLKEINNVNNLNQIGDVQDLFAFKINYETVENSVNDRVKPLFNGNISETFWRTSADNTQRSYGYRYDKLNRLLAAIYQKNGQATFAYDESMKYDKNGNIQHLVRNGAMDAQNQPLEIDALEYFYDPFKNNQLMRVYDASTNPEGFKDNTPATPEIIQDDYAYDANGNMKSDRNKGITLITYNHLNLPVKIVFDSEYNKIEYLYTSSGQKVQKTVTQNGTIVGTTYLGGFQYNGKVLLFFPTAEGYVNYTAPVISPDIGGTGMPESFNYVFNYTDHLGNIRVSYGIDPSTQALKVIEENHYYPFGLKHTKYNTDWNQFGRVDGNIGLRPGRPVAPLEYKYKYNGKELQDELGLNLYDYGARNYDPAIGRFMNVDRMAERYENLTPYNYTGNNPVYFIDINGEWIYVHDGDNQYRYDKGKLQNQMNGNWTEVDVSSMSDFVQNIVSGLDALAKSGETGKGLIDYFSGDKNDVNFKYEKGAFRPDGNNIFIDPKASNLNWTQSEQGYTRTESPFFVKVGHEMAHVQDPTKYHNAWYNSNVSEGEIRASHIENKIRQESGLPLRTHYGTTYNPTTKSYYPNSSSTLIDCTGNSVYYNHSEGRYLHRDSRGRSAPNQMGASINDGRRADSGGILKYRYNYNEGQ